MCTTRPLVALLLVSVATSCTLTVPARDQDAAAPDTAVADGAAADVSQLDADLADAAENKDAEVGDASVPDADVQQDAAPTGCPATAEHVERWWTTPWVAPSSGTAEQIIPLSTQNQLHFSRALITFEMETTTIPGDWTHIGVMRNRAIPGSWPYLAYYGWLLVRNIPTNRQIEVALNNCQNGTSYAILEYTNYVVTYDYDAIAQTATLTLAEPGGGSVSASCNTATSSLVPIGQGLHIYMGMNTNHPDYPVVAPPWGWTFRNFVADLTPGGPLGPDAPPCP